MIAITLGDPKSINIEILVDALNQLSRSGNRILVIGSFKCYQFQVLKFNLNLKEDIKLVKSLSEVSESGISFYDVPIDHSADPENMTTRQRGSVALNSLKVCAHLSELKKFPINRFAVVTCPINKANCIEAGMKKGGQTEFFSENWQGESIMVLAGDKLRVGLITNHIPVSQLREHFSQKIIKNKLLIFEECLKSIFQIDVPKVAVCGLNPHAGENGEVGDEEGLFITPVIRELQSSGRKVSGPESADTIFLKAYRGEYDGVLACYHDQGLAPLKLVEFESAINITYGLKHLRLSPDHGPAENLYGKSKASSKSLLNALSGAVRYVNGCS